MAADLDRRTNPEDCFSWDIVEKGSAVGLRTLTLAREYGGAGAGSLTTAMVIEEIAKGDMGVSVVFAQVLKLIQAFQAAANDDQRARFLPKLKDDPRYLMAIGITEPRQRVELHHSLQRPEDAVRHDGGAQGQRLGDQRQEAFHLERQSRVALSAVRADRSRRRASSKAARAS